MKAAIIDFNQTLFDPEKNEFVEGAFSLLQFLRWKGLKLVLLSIQELEREEKISPISSFFEVIRIVEEKTLAEFKSILSLLDVSPSDVIVIGDSILEEILLGNQLGMMTIRVRQGKFAKDLPSSPQEEAQISVDNLLEVISFLNAKKLGGI